MQFALQNPVIPKIYGNAFQGFLNTHDVTLLCSVNTVPTGLVLMSYPMAKALGVLLTEITAKYESLTGEIIPSVADLDAVIKVAAAAQGK